MTEEIQKDCGGCPFFKFCGAEVIRENRGENWYQRFCFADFKNCVHYQDKAKIKCQERGR